MRSAILRFEKLNRSDETALVEMAREFREEGDDRFAGLLDDPDGYFRNADEFENDRDLPAHLVPMTHYFLFNEDRLIGGSRLRRRLSPILLLDGGHIGYEVRPSERRRGYAIEILKRTLDKARMFGLDRVLLTAEISNGASRRVIERAGGIADGESISPQTGEQMQRFWIDL